MIKLIIRDIGKFFEAIGMMIALTAILAWTISLGGLGLIPMTFEEGVPRFMTWVAVAFSLGGWIIVGIDYFENLKERRRKEIKERQRWEK